MSADKCSAVAEPNVATTDVKTEDCRLHSTRPPSAVMGKGTDKLYITHSEWTSDDAFGTSRGFNSGTQAADATFKRLPFNYCAVSLQPFTDPVCTASGTIFDLSHILLWLQKHSTDPVDGAPLKRADLITLRFTKNEDGEYVDSVTYKAFTNNTHLVALRKSGNVFAWDTVERLNVKAKHWRDLLSDEEFSRSDIITLQDPQNIEARNFNAFKHVREDAGGNTKIVRAKEAVAKARAEREQKAAAGSSRALVPSTKSSATPASTAPKKPAPYNAAVYTSGKAAASFTSTGLTPYTSGERALLSEEEYMLKPKRVKQKGYARMSTNLGDLNLELLPEFAPKAVWNFVRLAQSGYYRGTCFHRSIPGFMIQGGDPTGTGKGGQSIWSKPFNDELEGPHIHNARGVVSMANKGKHTNTSQFFVLFDAAPHLDRKHTVFARVVGGLDTTLRQMERVETGDKGKPVRDIRIQDIVVFIDPFDEWRKERAEREAKEAEEERIRLSGGRDEDRVTWTGKRIRPDGTGDEGGGGDGGVGKYLKATNGQPGAKASAGTVLAAYEPVKKRARTGEFGNFDGW